MDYRVRRTFFPSGWCFFYLVTTGWIFDISLCDNSINKSIKDDVADVMILENCPIFIVMLNLLVYNSTIQFCNIAIINSL